MSSLSAITLPSRVAFMLRILCQIVAPHTRRRKLRRRLGLASPMGIQATTEAYRNVGWIEPFARPNAPELRHAIHARRHVRLRLLGLVKNSTQPTELLHASRNVGWIEPFARPNASELRHAIHGRRHVRLRLLGLVKNS